MLTGVAYEADTSSYIFKVRLDFVRASIQSECLGDHRFKALSTRLVQNYR